MPEMNQKNRTQAGTHKNPKKRVGWKDILAMIIAIFMNLLPLALPLLILLVILLILYFIS